MVRRLGWDGRVGRDALGGEVCVVGQRVERSAVEGEGDLDFGFVGVAVYEGGTAAGRWFGHYYYYYLLLGEKRLCRIYIIFFSDKSAKR